MKLERIYYDTKPRAEPTFDEDHKSRLICASKQKTVHLIPLEPHTLKCAIIGGSPSLENQLEQIKEFKKHKYNVIISVNGAHKWLLDNGVTPNIHVLFEADLNSVIESTGCAPSKDVIYYTCSHLHSNIFKELEGYKKVLWHCFIELDGYEEFISKLFPNQVLVTGPYCSLFRSLTIAVILGFRNIELFGCDASFVDGLSHYEGYHTKLDEPEMTVVAGTQEVNREFITTPFLSYQADTFLQFCRSNPGLKIQVHGDGLMKYLHKMEFPEQYVDI